MTGADAIAQQLKKLEKNYRETFWELARLLKELKQDHASEFKDYLKDVNIKNRTAYYLIAMFNAFEPLVSSSGPQKVEVRQLRKIGWTKLMYLANGVTPENAAVRLAWAEKYTVANLKRVLAGKEPIFKSYNLQFNLTHDQFKSVSNALSKFGATVSDNKIEDKESALILALATLTANK